jgi:enoyl-CoA hydratase/carnithine racemase
MGDQSVLITEIDAGVAVLTLNRPDKLNALNVELREAIQQRLAGLAADPEVRVVVLTGEGRAFCAGADLSGGGLSGSMHQSLASFDHTSARQFAAWNLSQPVIAAVNGYCLGRGMELALWCDIVIAARSATFGEPEVRDGSFVSSILPWLVGPQRAKLLMLSGDSVTARQAEAAGFVTQVVESDDARPAAIALARRLAHVPAPVAQAVKSYVNAAVDGMSLGAGQHYGNALAAGLHTLTADELGTTELIRIREEQGLRAYLRARDAPFLTSD